MYIHLIYIHMDMHVLTCHVPESQLDALLEEKLIFLVDATGIPVLLSLLTPCVCIPSRAHACIQSTS